MIRNMIRSIAFVAALSLAFATSDARAGFTGSVVLNPTTGGSVTINTPGLSTLTSDFTISSSITATSGIGDLSGATGLVFIGSPIELDTTSSSKFSFTNSYGTFQQTALAIDGFVGGFDVFKIVGTFTGGTYAGPTNAEVDLAFTEVGGPGTPVSVSGTMAVGGAVPEPASIAMLGLGLMAVGGFVARRRLATKRNASIA
jgi:PEP-CTERM motif